jgi:REP element-mobilizing transposase RayT
MSRQYKFHNQESLYFITYTVVNWIDLFTRNEYKNTLLKCWKYCCENKGLEVYAWVIMTNHVHMIIGSNKNLLEGIMRDVKRHTSFELKKMIQKHPGESRKKWMLKLMEEAGKKNSNNENFQLWQQHNHPIELSSDYLCKQKLNYIHENPVKAGIVYKAEEYLYSSARDYYYGKHCGLFPIVFLE